MLQPFFLLFYCLSITDAVLLVVVVSVGYLILRQWLGNKRFWLSVIALLFLAWLAVIAAATLTDRTPGIIPCGTGIDSFSLLPCSHCRRKQGNSPQQFHECDPLLPCRALCLWATAQELEPGKKSHPCCCALCAGKYRDWILPVSLCAGTIRDWRCVP